MRLILKLRNLNEKTISIRLSGFINEEYFDQYNQPKSCFFTYLLSLLFLLN
jgi:hypothetical protein